MYREWATDDDDCVSVTFTLSHFMHVCKLVENIGSQHQGKGFTTGMPWESGMLVSQ